MSHPRWVLDTNVVVAGLLWNGHARRLLEWALDGHLKLISSPILLAELARTLGYGKFANRIRIAETTTEALVERYAELVTLARPAITPRVVANDPDDDHVVACAVAAKADTIVSGDRHLLDLQPRYLGIDILTPRQAAERMA